MTGISFLLFADSIIRERQTFFRDDQNGRLMRMRLLLAFSFSHAHVI